MLHLPKPIIQRSFRRSISLHVTRDGDFVVKAPHFAPQFVIDTFIHEKEDWILQTLEKVGRKKSPIKKYAEGELFYFLGEQRALSFYNGIEIKVKDKQLLFPKAIQFRVKKELEMWLGNAARELITQRVVYHNEKMATHFTGLLFSDTKSKWGTCFPDNSLQFNIRLIMAPLLVIDYVVIHELAHTTEKNHSAAFWRRVGRFTPAYRQHRKWLNEHGHVLHL